MSLAVDDLRRIDDRCLELERRVDALMALLRSTQSERLRNRVTDAARHSDERNAMLAHSRAHEVRISGLEAGGKLCQCGKA